MRQRHSEHKSTPTQQYKGTTAQQRNNATTRPRNNTLQHTQTHNTPATTTRTTTPTTITATTKHTPAHNKAQQDSTPHTNTQPQTTTHDNTRQHNTTRHDTPTRNTRLGYPRLQKMQQNNSGNASRVINVTIPSENSSFRLCCCLCCCCCCLCCLAIAAANRNVARLLLRSFAPLSYSSGLYANTVSSNACLPRGRHNRKSETRCICSCSGSGM